MGLEIQIPDKLFFKIGDVADLIGVKPYVLRYWETEFPVLSPGKSNSGQRVYRRSDVENLMLIKHLLYTKRYSIEGARKRIRELRKEGDLKKYKNKEVLGETSTREHQDRMRTLRKRAEELVSLVKTPLHEIFRF